MTNYISITVGDMKTKLFLLKANVLKFTQQKFERKNQRNKRFIKLSQMFNMRALAYTAHIETVFHFLPNSNKHFGIDGYQGSVIQVFRSSTDVGRGGT